MKPGLAILQNMWMRDPERTKRSIARFGEEYRIKLIQYALFRGCLTGRRLKTAFGEELLDQILFEESTREIAGDPKTIFPPDEAHIERIILQREPKVVIALGKISAAACFRVLQKMTFGSSGTMRTLRIALITAPHPAARQAEVPALLKAAAEKFRKAIA